MFVEQMMFFALGLLTALLFTLGMVPALSRRAMRLARRKLELQLPLSPAEILAERDQLRADFAVQMRISEQKIAKVQTDYATVSGKLGHSIAKSVALDQENTTIKQQLAQIMLELTHTRRKLNEAEGEKAAVLMALHDQGPLPPQTTSQHFIPQTELNAERNALKAEHAGIDAMKASLELQQLELQRKIAEMNTKISLASEETLILTQERDLARVEIEKFTASIRQKSAHGDSTRLAEDELALLRDTILNIAADVVRQSAAHEPAASPLHALIAEAKINRAAHINAAEKSLMDRVNRL